MASDAVGGTQGGKRLNICSYSTSCDLLCDHRCVLTPVPTVNANASGSGHRSALQLPSQTAGVNWEPRPGEDSQAKG